jgi:hypothetical protein
MKYVIVIILLIIPISAFADAWHFESVDTERDVGWYTSIALDSSGYPHISYYIKSKHNLKYAYYDGADWQVEPVDAAATVGSYNSIALDSLDYPHISYYNHSEHDLYIAHFDGSAWRIEPVDTTESVGYYTSVALDVSDNPHISYYDGTNGYLKYAYYDGAAWQIEFVDTEGENVGRFTSLALDASDYPHISYYDDRENYDLKYAYYDGAAWQIETVDTEGDVGLWTSLALDSSGYSHVSYYDATNGHLKYAYYDGIAWQIEPVDTEGDVGLWTSIALDSSGYPHISYHDATNGYLKYAYHDGVAWQIEPVDTEGEVGLFTSIALDTSGRPHISYYDASNADLEYAWYNEAPTDFNLLSPGDGDYVSGAPAMDWENAEDDQPVTYDFWYSEETDFDPQKVVTELTDSVYTFDEGVLADDMTYYWKVRAWDGYDETWSGPDDYWSFTVDYELDITVTDFSAASAVLGIEVSWECTDDVAGFNLYRSVGPGEGKANTSRDKLNAELFTGESPYTYLDAAVEEGVTYRYWLEAVNVGGATETFGPVECTWNGALPTTYALYQSRPNPATGTATLAFDLPEDAEVTLTVYDISGRKVTTVVNETLTAGEHEAEVSGLAPGVYVYKLDAGTFSAARKMVIVE